MNNRYSTLATALALMALAGCASTSGGSSAQSAPPPPSSPAAIPPGMNANGEVIDPTKVEAGYGQKVKGINDFEGEITGVPAPGSRFPQLQIGMGMRQVVDILGPPSDMAAYITGKAFIPFYFGSDRSRIELLYRGQGRLIFAGGAVGTYTRGNLIWIINSAAESGYR
jgi:hypothetical protein